jgi:hypothetical protein
MRRLPQDPLERLSRLSEMEADLRSRWRVFLKVATERNAAFRRELSDLSEEAERARSAARKVRLAFLTKMLDELSELGVLLFPAGPPMELTDDDVSFLFGVCSSFKKALDEADSTALVWLDSASWRNSANDSSRRLFLLREKFGFLGGAADSDGLDFDADVVGTTSDGDVFFIDEESLASALDAVCADEER